MQLLLIRHAIAAERSAAIADAERPLIGRGIKRFRQVVRGLDRLDLRPDHVLHSPWLRAVQTAALMTPIVEGELEPTPLLTDAPGEALLARVARFPDSACVGLVGHEPWMGELLSLLLTGAPDHAEHLPFKKGGVAWVEGYARPGAMALRAMLPPRALRRLAEDT